MSPRAFILLALAGAASACTRADAVAPAPTTSSAPFAAPGSAPGSVTTRREDAAVSPRDPLADLRQEGEQPASPVQGALLVDESPSARFAWLAERGHCYRIVAVGDTPDPMALAIRDGADKQLTASKGGEATVETCARHRGNLVVEITGRGRVTAQVLSMARRAAPAPARVATATPSERDLLAQRIATQARTAAPGARRVAALFRGNAYQTDWTQHLEAKRCYTLIAAGSETVKNLGLYLWDPSGSRVSSQRSSTNDALVYHCTTTAGPYRFQGKLNFGKGEYAVGVFVKG